jgi:hypothetical protein
MQVRQTLVQKVVLPWQGLTIQAFFSGTIWSMSRSEAAVNLRSSYGDTQLPDTATHALLVWTLVPSRLRTNSLDGVSQHRRKRKGGVTDEAELTETHRVLQVPEMVSQVGNLSREYPSPLRGVATWRPARRVFAVEALGIPG